MDLFFATAIGNTTRIEKILNETLDLIHSTDSKKRTPIFYSIIYRRRNSLDTILSLSKPDLEHIDEHGYTVYDYAYYIDSHFGSNYLGILENVRKASYLNKNIQIPDLSFDSD